MHNIPLFKLSNIYEKLNHTQKSNDFLLYEFNIDNAPFFSECRLDVYFLAFLHQGEIEIESDLFTQKITSPAIFALAPSVIRRFVGASNNFRSEVMFFEKSFFLERLADSTYLDKYEFFSNENNHLLNLSKNEYDDFSNYFRLIRKEVNENNHYSNDIVRNILQIALYKIADLHIESKEYLNFSHNQFLISQFKSNLEKYYIHERKVSFYAEKQNLSSKHFSKVIKQMTGKTAGEIIDEKIILEAQALLHKKDITVNQIASMLNFSDASNFSKFYKKHTSKSPYQYRGVINQ